MEDCPGTLSETQLLTIDRYTREVGQVQKVGDTTITSMAQLYGQDASRSSALYVLSTLLSILTMPLMLGLFSALL